MRSRHVFAAAGLWAGVLVVTASSQAPSSSAPERVDFRRDVQPLLRQHCYGCHGPKTQRNGFRLDRRKDALRGGTIVVISPGNSAGSRLYNKLISSQYGPQMPPAGPLPADAVDTLKRWIDQGVEWPDDLAGDTPVAPPDPAAQRVMDALRAGDRATATKLLAADPAVVNRKGFGGATPLMYATLYGDATLLGSLLEHGADANVPNEAGATALMWAIPDLAKVRLLVEHGADVNARSDDGRTPLLIAAGQYSAGPLVEFLLERGANVGAKSPGLFGDVTPLLEAARVGDVSVMRMLIDHHADPKAAGPVAVALAGRAGCPSCADMLMPSLDPASLAMTTFLMSPPLGPALGVQAMLDRGVDARAAGPNGLTLLMLAASSEALPTDTIAALIAKGADVNAKAPNGETAREIAERLGRTPVVDLLAKAGATDGAPMPAARVPSPASSPRAALERSLPLLQHTDTVFLQKSGCVSCHNDTLTAMSVAAAGANGMTVDRQSMDAHVKTVATYLETWRDRALEGVGIPGDADTVAAILLDLGANHYPGDTATDAMARFLLLQQLPDGHWLPLAHRPPIESSLFQVTATSMRALQLYAPAARRAEYDAAIKKAAAWLAAAKPAVTEDRAFQLIGLGWAGGARATIAAAARALRAEQRPDGGWSQLPSLTSDAFATGQALVALREAGGAAPTDPAVARGIKFLVNSQMADGSWYVHTRAIPLQPYFESGFPYGHDQWISAAATNWAAMALARAK